MSEVFVQIVILVTFLDTFKWNVEGAQLIEFFAGRGRISRLGRAAGLSVLSYDILYMKPRKGKRSAMDMNSCSGYAFPSWEQHIYIVCLSICCY
jgi:hypothetical protein